MEKSHQNAKQAMSAAAEAGTLTVRKHGLAIGLTSAIIVGSIEITRAWSRHRTREYMVGEAVILFVIVPLIVFVFHKLRTELSGINGQR